MLSCVLSWHLSIKFNLNPHIDDLLYLNVRILSYEKGNFSVLFLVELLLIIPWRGNTWKGWSYWDRQVKAMVYFGYMMTSSNGNILRVTGPLWGESIGHQWIPLTKTTDAELWFFFICAWFNSQANSRDAGDLRRHRAHYDVTVLQVQFSYDICTRFCFAVFCWGSICSA